MRRTRSIVVVAAAATLLATAGCGGSGSSKDSNKRVTITVWEGYKDTEGGAFHQLVDEFNKTHTDITVSVLETDNDYALEKVLTSRAGRRAS